MANDDFAEPPRRADSKNPIFFFSANFESRSPPGTRGSVGRILGGMAIEPFGVGGGGASHRAVSTPPPFSLKLRPPKRNLTAVAAGPKWDSTQALAPPCHVALAPPHPPPPPHRPVLWPAAWSIRPCAPRTTTLRALPHCPDALRGGGGGARTAACSLHFAFSVVHPLASLRPCRQKGTYGLVGH